MLRVELAYAPQDLQAGLMFRRKLAADDGMLFCFKQPHNLRFWGRNTYIPLDIAFVDGDNIIRKISNINAMSEKSVSSDNMCAIAIEANLGYFEQKRIRVGDSIDITRLNDKRAIVNFSRT